MHWKDILSQNGYRVSEPRKKIMELLESSELALSPLQIHQQLLDKNCDLGLVSVYRTLDLLTELNLVTVVYDPERNPGYILASGGHHHHIVVRNAIVLSSSPVHTISTILSIVSKPKLLT